MQTLGKFPSVRMRRMRHDDFSRRLMRESRVSVEDNSPILPHDDRARTNKATKGKYNFLIIVTLLI